jgi:hypothetical protein
MENFFNFLSDYRFTDNRRSIIYIGIFSIKFEKKIETRLFLPGIHQKYSSSSECVDNRDIRINKYKNLPFRLILTEKIWAHRDSNQPKN